MKDSKYFIYPYNWWNGFCDKTDANHIGFFEKLFSNTKIRNFEITYDINKANILFEANISNDQIKNFKKWIYKINFIGEPALPEYEKYDLVLTSINHIDNIVDLPLSIVYIHCNNFLKELMYREKINQVPKKFCSFIVTNPKCKIRNYMFEKLNKYKKVDSMGEFANNVGHKISYPYWSKEYLKCIGEYKFMLCFENNKMETYSTEKIVNPYLAKTIPIYWGSSNIKNIFNIDSILFLEDESEDSIQHLINKIIELDNDDEKYLKFINNSILTDENLNFWNNNYTLEILGNKIDKILI